MDAELIYKAQAIQKEIEEMQTHAQLIDRELAELQQFKKDLVVLEKREEKGMLSSLGKGVFLKTEAVSKELFVEVGAGIVVKKTSAQTQEVIEQQIKKISEARLHTISKLELYHQALRQIIQTIQQEQQTHGKKEA
ncbi:MAG: prefoldin subunit alpha [Nanoarchaeota archaeon]